MEIIPIHNQTIIDTEIIEVKQLGWKDDLLRVDLTISNICNYKCWYCYPGCNTGTIKWPEFNSYVENLSHLLDHYINTTNKKKIDFHIMGGEVTHWKQLPNFIKYFKEKYDCVFTLTTNASKNIPWWEETYQYLDYVAISVHPQFSNPNHVREVADFLYEKNVYVVTLVLMDPNDWDKCLDIVDTLKNSKHKWTIRYNEVVHNTIQYTDSQRAIIEKQRARKTNLWYYLRTNKSYNSKVKVIDINGKKKSFKDNELLLRRMNNFKNWECNVGVDWIAIKNDGTVSGICGNGLYENSEVYNLNDIDFKKKFNPTIVPTICKQSACWCGFETNMSKRKCKK